MFVFFFWFSVSCKDIVDSQVGYGGKWASNILELVSLLYNGSLTERVQKRALSIIAPDKSYKHCVVSFGLSSLYDRRNDQCI